MSIFSFSFFDNLINNLTMKKSKIRLVIKFIWPNFVDNIVGSNLRKKKTKGKISKIVYLIRKMLLGQFFCFNNVLGLINI
jgi:hypothetical protein